MHDNNVYVFFRDCFALSWFEHKIGCTEVISTWFEFQFELTQLLIEVSPRVKKIFSVYALLRFNKVQPLFAFGWNIWLISSKYAYFRHVVLPKALNYYEKKDWEALYLFFLKRRFLFWQVNVPYLQVNEEELNDELGK